MASSPVDQTTQSQPALTTSEEIKSLYPKEVYKNWSKCYGNPDAHRQEDLSFQTTAITFIERWIPKEESWLEGNGRAILELDTQRQKIEEYWTKTTELRQKELDRHKKNIREINEERRQLKVFEKHYLGRND
ncbi:unnamed protein product [Aureobasidium pullulans]|nr:unnamed protein product [Aureobasidium pullulans]